MRVMDSIHRYQSDEEYVSADVRTGDVERVVAGIRPPGIHATKKTVMGKLQTDQF